MKSVRYGIFYLPLKEEPGNNYTDCIKRGGAARGFPGNHWDNRAETHAAPPRCLPGVRVFLGCPKRTEQMTMLLALGPEPKGEQHAQRPPTQRPPEEQV